MASLTTGATACVTTRPFPAPQHTISDTGLIGRSQLPPLGEVSWRTTASYCWLSDPPARARSLRSGDNRLKMAAHKYNLPRVIAIDLAALAAIAARGITPAASYTAR
jgi:hypothetical protein